MSDFITNMIKANKPARTKKPVDKSLDSLIRSRLKSELPTPATVTHTSTITNGHPSEYNPSKVIGKGDVINVNNAYDDSVKLVKQKMKKDNTARYNALSLVKKGDIFVVKGCYDNIEKILDASNIPYYTSQDNLNKCEIVFVNCSSEYKGMKGKELKAFVKKGGYLVSTDWALGSVIQKYFGKIGYKGKNTTNDVVDIDAPDKENFYVGNAFPKGIKPAWWLEGASHCIDIKKPDDVKVLLRSEELKQKYGSDVVGVTFRHGRGRVFHFISHFKLQQSKEYVNADMKTSDSFAKNVLDLNDQEINASGINKNRNYAAVETAYTSAMIVHNIIAAKKMGFNGD